MMVGMGLPREQACDLAFDVTPDEKGRATAQLEMTDTYRVRALSVYETAKSGRERTGKAEPVVGVLVALTVETLQGSFDVGRVFTMGHGAAVVVPEVLLVKSPELGTVPKLRAEVSMPPRRRADRVRIIFHGTEVRSCGEKRESSPGD